MRLPRRPRAAGRPARDGSRVGIDGCRAALETGGVACDEALVRHGTFQTEAGHRVASELSAMRDRPTARFAGNGIQAMGVYQAARELGPRIPEDVSVVGSDDLPISGWMGPPVSDGAGALPGGMGPAVSRA